MNFFLSVKIFESCDSVILINRLEYVLVVGLDFLRSESFIERSIIVWLWGEKTGSCRVEFDVCLLANSILPKGLLTQIEHLLGCTAAFDWEWSLSENGIASAEIIPQNRRFVGAIESIHGPDGAIRIIKCFLSPRYLVVSKFQAWSNDKIIVGML